MRIGAVAVLATLSLLVVPGISSAATTGGDFDRDGIDDLAVGAPAEDLTFELEEDAGAVHVIYGHRTGLRSDVTDLLTDDTVGGETEAGDTFGASLAAGDFDGDGFDDLAIGVIGETVGGATRAGAIQVVPGSRHGLRPVRGYSFTQADLGVTVETDDFFGEELAAGNFGRGTQDDLAIGTPNETIQAVAAVGAGFVSVVYGTPGGLDASDDPDLFNQGDLDESPEINDRFGDSLAAGDFGGGKFDELAIGVPNEEFSFGGDPISEAGIIHVLKGRQGGFAGADQEIVSRASAGIAGTPRPGDRFGSSLAAGDIGFDKRSDLAIGAPTDQHGTLDERRGSVNVIYGSRVGLSFKADQLWSQASAGIAGAPANGDFFGTDVTIGDFGNNRRGDLAVGIPGDATETQADPALRGGSVAVIYGTPQGLSNSGDLLVSQENAGVADTAEALEQFGAVLTSGDFGRGRQEELVVGVATESINALAGAGAINVLYGRPGGLSGQGSHLFSQVNIGGGETAEAQDGFGASLSR